MSIGRHSITSETPSNILLGAGTYYRGLTHSGTAWNGTPIGATSGGGKISIKGEYVDLDIDGALVKFKGQTIKQGGTATAEVNFVELSENVLRLGTNFTSGESDAVGFVMYRDKARIEDGDYIENFGFVGYTADGSKQIVVIFEHALCTSGLEIEAKNKEQSVIKLTLEAVVDIALNDGSLNALPVKIYYPTGA